MVIPDFTEKPVGVARMTALALGLRARVVNSAGSACLPRRTVLEQRPAQGTQVAAGSRVLLVINSGGFGTCGLHLPAAPRDLRRIADLFADFARDKSPGPPADTPVDLYVGGVLQRAIPSGDVSDRRQWRVCPGGIGYAARSCPISALVPFVEYPGPIAATTRPPTHPCLAATELPGSLEVYRAVTLTPDENRDCTSYFAVQLFVNDAGQIIAVNLVLSEP